MRLIFIGPPGVGKGTQATLIKDHFDILHLSTGDILREEIAQQSTVGIKAKSFMDRGHLVPDNILLEMMEKRLQQPDSENGYLLDGFPRTIPQAEGLDDILERTNQVLDAVVSIKLDIDSIVKRLSSRRSCKKCGSITNLLFNPPKTKGRCDICSGELVQRSDDKDEVIINRLKVYNEQTAPLLDYYTNKGLIKTINGQGDIAVIKNNILEVLA